MLSIAILPFRLRVAFAFIFDTIGAIAHHRTTDSTSDRANNSQECRRAIAHRHSNDNTGDRSFTPKRDRLLRLVWLYVGTGAIARFFDEG